VNFYDSSYNYGYIYGNAVFNDSSYNYYGTITGDATFNDTNYNMTLRDESTAAATASLAENRLEIFTNSRQLGARAVCMFVYASSLQRWVLVSYQS
jgi:hypothetical protein